MEHETHYYRRISSMERRRIFGRGALVGFFAGIAVMLIMMYAGN